MSKISQSKINIQWTPEMIKSSFFSKSKWKPRWNRWHSQLHHIVAEKGNHWNSIYCWGSAKLYDHFGKKKMFLIKLVIYPSHHSIAFIPKELKLCWIKKKTPCWKLFIALHTVHINKLICCSFVGRWIKKRCSRTFQ